MRREGGRERRKERRGGKGEGGGRDDRKEGDSGSEWINSCRMRTITFLHGLPPGIEGVHEAGYD